MQTEINFNIQQRAIINENNHPFRHFIIGGSIEQLLNRKPYVIGAIDAWKKNKYNAEADKQAYNISYFEAELKIISKELEKRNFKQY